MGNINLDSINFATMLATYAKNYNQNYMLLSYAINASTYVKCGRINKEHELSDIMSQRDVMSLTRMIAVQA